MEKQVDSQTHIKSHIVADVWGDHEIRPKNLEFGFFPTTRLPASQLPHPSSTGHPLLALVPRANINHE